MGGDRGTAPIDPARYGGFEFVRATDARETRVPTEAVDEIFSPLDPVIVDAEAVRLPEDQRLE